MNVLGEFTIATIKSNLREKQALFWVFVFPLMMFIIFGVLLPRGEAGASVTVYIANSTTAEELAEHLKRYNITVKIVEGVDSPVEFLKKITARGEAAVFVSADENITVYSTSLYGPMVAGLIEKELVERMYSKWSGESMPWNFTFPVLYVNPKSGVLHNTTYRVTVYFTNSSQARVIDNQTQIIVLIPTWTPQVAEGINYVDLRAGVSKSSAITWLVRMQLIFGLYLILTVAYTIHGYHVVGFLKRLYLRPGTKQVFLMAVTLGGATLPLLAAVAVLILAYLAEYPVWVLANIGFLAAMISNMLFGAGVGLLLSAADVGLRGGHSPPLLPLPLILLLAFLCGYFMPAELLPEDVGQFIRPLPPYVTRAFAEAAVLFNTYNWPQFAAAFLTSATVFIGGLLLHPIIKKT